MGPRKATQGYIDARDPGLQSFSRRSLNGQLRNFARAVYLTFPDEFPPGWNKTLADLFAESKESHSPIGPPEADWARSYERSLLRSWARFPLDGDVYEAVEDTAVKFLTHWRAPFTGGGSGTLPKGTRVRVKVPDWMREPVGVYADPFDAERIEGALVSEADRNNAKYGGFSLSISTAELNKCFRLVQGE